MKIHLFFLSLLPLTSLWAQNNELLHGIRYTNTENGRLQYIKQYDHGKKTGIWTFYAIDSSHQLSKYKNDSLREKININPHGDTLLRWTYLYNFTIDNRLLSSLIYSKSKPILRIIHNYRGLDSLYEKYDLNSGKFIFSLSDSVYKMPSFKGGEDAYFNFLRDNMIYPDKEAKERIEGNVSIRFIIEIDGSISEVNRKIFRI